MTTRGYRNVSISDICRESESSVGSLYHHFGSKAGLLREVIRALGDRLYLQWSSEYAAIRVWQPGWPQLWRTAMDAIIDNYAYFSLDFELAVLAQADSEIRAVFDEQTKLVRGLIADMLALVVRELDLARPADQIERLSAIVFYFTRGVVTVAGQDLVVVRRELEKLTPIISDALAHTARNNPNS